MVGAGLQGRAVRPAAWPVVPSAQEKARRMHCDQLLLKVMTRSQPPFLQSTHPEPGKGEGGTAQAAERAGGAEEGRGGCRGREGEGGCWGWERLWCRKVLLDLTVAAVLRPWEACLPAYYTTAHCPLCCCSSRRRLSSWRRPASRCAMQGLILLEGSSTLSLSPL